MSVVMVNNTGKKWDDHFDEAIGEIAKYKFETPDPDSNSKVITSKTKVKAIADDIIAKTWGGVTKCAIKHGVSEWYVKEIIKAIQRRKTVENIVAEI